MQGRHGGLGEDRSQFLAQGSAPADEDADTRADAELAERLDLGCGGHDGGVCRQQDEPGVVRAKHTPGHADPEKGRGAFGEHFERPGKTIDERGTEAADLADQAQQFRSTRGEAEDRSDDRVESFPLPFRPRQAGVDGLSELTGDGQENGVEKPVLGAVVVEKGLFGAPGSGGDSVERRRPDTSRRERGKGGVENTHGRCIARENSCLGEVSGRH